MIGRTNARSGGSGLNLYIKAYATESELLADTPKEHTIGIVAIAPITLWIMNAAPGIWSSVYGSINIVFESSAYYDDTTVHTKLMRGKISGITGETWIKLTGCYQSDGAKSIAVTAYIYKNGTWVQFSAAFASTINVTYPAGSTCTATDGTTTLTAPDTTGSWACVVPNTGTWTVTATDGSSTATGSVSITSDGQSTSITLSYALYLYTAGQTSGFSAHAIPQTSGDTKQSPSISYGSSSMVISVTTAYAGGAVTTSSKVDLTNYKTLTFTGSIGGGNSTLAVWSSIGSYWGANIVASTSFSTSTTLDVSGLTGSYYIGFGMANGSSSRSVTVTSLYLS